MCNSEAWILLLMHRDGGSARLGLCSVWRLPQRW